MLTKVRDCDLLIVVTSSTFLIVVRRGLGIAFHIGRRVRDGHLKGPGPNRI